MSDFLSFILSFTFNLLIVLALVRFIYYPSTHNKQYVLTFLAFNTVIYFVLSFMESIQLGIGVGFGLFAIFTILRYRTDPIPIREMTYMFLTAALAVMNSAGSNVAIWPQLIAANAIILILMLVLEKEWGFHYEISKRIIYEKIELVRPDRQKDLILDLEERTGLKVKRVAVGKINFMRDTADLRIYYENPDLSGWMNEEDSGVMVVSKMDDDD